MNESRPLTGYSKVCSGLFVLLILTLISTRSFITDTLVFTLDRRPHLGRIIELIPEPRLDLSRLVATSRKSMSQSPFSPKVRLCSIIRKILTDYVSMI